MTARLIAAAAVLVLAAVADWCITRSRVPPLPRPCGPANVACNTARDLRVQRLADDVLATSSCAFY